MNLNSENTKTIIERDVHCPYCDSDKALLISEIANKRSVLKLSDLDKKYWLSLYFTFGLYALVHGFPFFEKKRIYEYNTYGFCPHCGKTYNAGVPNSISAEKSKKIYRSLRDKKLLGICGGVAEFTGLNVNLVRIALVIHSLLLAWLIHVLLFVPIKYAVIFILFPAVIYFVLGVLNIIEVNPKQQKELNNQNTGGNNNG